MRRFKILSPLKGAALWTPAALRQLVRRTICDQERPCETYKCLPSPGWYSEPRHKLHPAPIRLLQKHAWPLAQSLHLCNKKTSTPECNFIKKLVTIRISQTKVPVGFAFRLIWQIVCLWLCFLGLLFFASTDRICISASKQLEPLKAILVSIRITQTKVPDGFEF